MNILIVDDDEYKIDQIKRAIRDTLPDATVSDKRSYISGLVEIMDIPFDLVLLDMTMPNYDMTDALSAGDVRLFAGENILDEMRREGVRTKALIITQFSVFGQSEDQTTLDELKIRLSLSFPDNYMGTIYFSASESKWREQLVGFLRELSR